MRMDMDINIDADIDVDTDTHESIPYMNAVGILPHPSHIHRVLPNHLSIKVFQPFLYIKCHYEYCLWVAGYDLDSKTILN